MANKRKCILCPSHEYEYCGKCKPHEVIETWRFIFDTENCRDIYKIIENYVAKKITALEARQQLEQHKLPELKDIQSSLRKNLEDIYNQTKEVYEQKNKIEDENKQVEFVREGIETVEEIKPRRRRFSRRNSN